MAGEKPTDRQLADARSRLRDSQAAARSAEEGRDRAQADLEATLTELRAEVERRREVEAALRRANEELEHQVRVRTLELRMANDWLRDELSTRERFEAELRRSNAELEQFAYVASHDLQEPLRMVVSYLQLIERRYKGKLDDSADEFIEFAVDGARRMQVLIEALLTYSRIGRAGGPMEPVDASEVVDRVIGDLGQAISESGGEVTRGDLPTVRGDRSQLGQLFQNLVANALKFRREGEPPRVRVEAERVDEGWRFAVRDNGPGIAPEFHDRVFVIFQRLHGRAEYPGTGIGLAIAKKIVERHGGRIWVESTPGAGATFFFTIPEGGAP